MKTRHNKQKNTTPEIALRKWCVEQAVKLAFIPRESRYGVRCDIAIITDGQVTNQAQEIYAWVKALP